MTSQPAAPKPMHCQVVRTLDIIGEKWSLLIIRDAFRGSSRYSEFRESLGVPSDILSARLAKLVDAGVLEKRGYREAGSRERFSYHLTESGQGLSVVLAAMVQWGDEFAPVESGRGWRVQDAEGRGLGLRFVDEAGAAREPAEVRFQRRAVATDAGAGAAPGAPPVSVAPVGIG